MIPTSIDGTDITGATIDGTDVQEITVDGQTVFTAGPLPVAFSNLVAWYPFDSATYGGSNADDVTAILGGSGDDTAYDGTVTGATYQSSGGVTDIRAGANSGAFSFADDRIQLPFTRIDVPFSLTIWSFTSDPALTSEQGQVFSNFSSTGDDFQIVYSSNPLRVRFGYDVGPGFHVIANVNANTYNHVAITYDGSTAKTYFNGSFVDSYNFTDSFIDNGEFFNIGTSDDGRGHNGSIDDVRLYNTALSSSQINQIYLNTQP